MHNKAMSEENPATEEETLEELPERPVEVPQAKLVRIDQIQLLENVRSVLGDVDGLAENIRVRGLLHPVVLRPAADRSHRKPYELVVGYRRLAAFQQLEREEIPAIIHQANEEELLAEVISENLQRENPSPIDEARAMQRMIDTFDWSHAQVAQQLKVDRSQVTKRLGLLRLPDKVQGMVSEGQLSPSHAEVVARLDNQESQVELAELAVRKETPVSKLHSYATKIKERENQDIREEDPETAQEDPTKPLDTVDDSQVVDLPALQVKAELSPEELLRADLYILLRSANDFEMTQVLAEKYGVTQNELWDWIGSLTDDQVLEMRTTMIRRWLGAAHRFSTLPVDLQGDLGEGTSSMSESPEPEIPVEPENDPVDLEGLEDWDEEWDDDGEPF